MLPLAVFGFGSREILILLVVLPIIFFIYIKIVQIIWNKLITDLFSIRSITFGESFLLILLGHLISGFK